jgi:tetratricopeptide (TPR) repeat protein
MPRPIRAFIAKSFFPEDEARVQPLLDFLGTLKPYGLICDSAEPAEPEGISVKVKRMIDDASIFVAIFTRKYPICRIGEDGSPSLLSPPKWTPPLWLLQEAGYALAKEKKLVFYIESGVELPQLAGDHEYIEYDSERQPQAFKRTSEMFSKLISNQLSLVLDTTLVQESQASSAPEVSQPPLTSASQEPPTSQGLSDFIDRMFECQKNDDSEGERRAFADGLEYIRANEPNREVPWRTFFLRERINNGDSAALNELKQVASEYPKESMPLSALGDAYVRFGNHRQALTYFDRALEMEPVGDRTWLVIKQANSLSEVGESDRAVSVLKAELEHASEADRSDLIERLYDVLKAKGDVIAAFGVGEVCLAENGAQSELHFKLAYDYDGSKFKDLSILHYTTLLQLKAQHTMALNNIGVQYRQIELPIASTVAYREADRLGETLATANLAYAYLDGGFVDEAQALLTVAMSKPRHHENVTHALADIENRKRAESEKLGEFIKAANKQRDFLRIMGEAYLDVNPGTEIDGAWLFPVGEITLTQLSPESAEGEGTNLIRGGGIASILGSSPVADTQEKFTLKAHVQGRVLEFRLHIRRSITGGYSPSTETRSGYLVFAKDGTSASVMVLEPDVEFLVVHRKPQMELAVEGPI